jgi:hypothetical protein
VVSITKFSRFFTGIFLGFLVFLRDYFTVSTTVLECSRLSTNISVLRTFIVSGVSEAPSEIACKRTKKILDFEGLGTDRFRAVIVVVKMGITTPALHVLLPIV